MFESQNPQMRQRSSTTKLKPTTAKEKEKEEESL